MNIWLREAWRKRSDLIQSSCTWFRLAHTPASSYLWRDLGQTLKKSQSNFLAILAVYSRYFSSKHLQVNVTRCQLRRFLKSVDNIPMVKYLEYEMWNILSLLYRRGDRVTGRPSRSGRTHLGWIKSRFQVHKNTNTKHKLDNTNFRIFDDIGAGFISVEKFRVKQFWVWFKANSVFF